MIKRIFIGKRAGYDTQSVNLLNDFKENLNVLGLERVMLFNRYDCQVENENNLDLLIKNVLSEVNVDNVYMDELPSFDETACFAVEYLPGQYDQRADSALQCAKLIMNDETIKIKNARIYLLFGSLSKDEIEKIKKYVINPVDSREIDVKGEINLTEDKVEVKETPVIEDFIDKNDKELSKMLDDMSLAMDINDLKLIKDYFKGLKRNPTLTEIKVLDTYWSDHCRHTTFLTKLNDIE